MHCSFFVIQKKKLRTRLSKARISRPKSTPHTSTNLQNANLSPSSCCPCGPVECGIQQLSLDSGGRLSLDVFLSTVLILFPVGENVANLRRVGKLVHILKVFFGQRKRLRSHVGNVLAD
jgi:hypothetical protein